MPKIYPKRDSIPLQSIPVRLVPPSLESRNMSRRYVFNETGNVMVCWVNQDTYRISILLNVLFNGAAVFLGDMVKEIQASINPKTNQPYSIYNYQAIMDVVEESRLFIHIAGGYKS